MTTFIRQPNQTLAVLGIMRDLAERGHGYEALGVRGWAPAKAVNELLGVFYAGRRYIDASEELRRGWKTRGYYVRIDVRVEGARSPVWIYRVRDDAARMLNEREKREHVPIPPPAEGMELGVWMPETAPHALDAMRWAAENPGKRLYVLGEPEWRTSLDLTNILNAQADDRNRAREAAGEPDVVGEREPAFLTGDIRWLVASGLAEERREDGRVIYRISVAGVNTRPLTWHGLPPDRTPRPD